MYFDLTYFPISPHSHLEFMALRELQKTHGFLPPDFGCFLFSHHPMVVITVPKYLALEQALTAFRMRSGHDLDDSNTVIFHTAFDVEKLTSNDLLVGQPRN
jgi:hypothetical protein